MSIGLRSGIFSGSYPEGIPAYTGALDVVTPVADFAVGSQLLYRNWAGDNADIRVGSTPSTIGFLNNKFDSDAWDVATGVQSPFDALLDYHSSGISLSGDIISDTSSDSSAYARFNNNGGLFTVGASFRFKFKLKKETMVSGVYNYFIFYNYGNAYYVTIDTDTGKIIHTYNNTVDGHLVESVLIDGFWNIVVDLRLSGLAQTRPRIAVYPSYTDTLGGAENLSLTGSVTVKDVTMQEYQNGFAYGTKWIDQSGNGNDAVQTVESKQPIVNRDGSILFDGVDDSIEVTFTTPIPTPSELSFITMVSFTDFNVQYCPVSLLSSGENKISLLYDQPNDRLQVYVIFPDGGVSVVVPNFNINYTTNVKYLITVTIKTSGSIVIYIDGVQVATGASKTTQLDTVTAVNIGRFKAGSRYLNGSLPFTSVHRSELSSQEVLDIYNQWLLNANS